MGEWSRKSRGFFTFMKTKGRLWILVGGALLGVLLLLLGGMGAKGEEQEVPDTLISREAELESYRTGLEKELEALCEAVGGVGDATVMLTLEQGFAVRYARDGEGNPVTVGTGSYEEALFESVQPPPVAGVAIVCRGGSNPAVHEKLTELVSTALGISSNRVYIAGK